MFSCPTELLEIYSQPLPWAIPIFIIKIMLLLVRDIMSDENRRARMQMYSCTFVLFPDRMSLKVLEDRKSIWERFRNKSIVKKRKSNQRKTPRNKMTTQAEFPRARERNLCVVLTNCVPLLKSSPKRELELLKILQSLSVD